jgi:hypothetical protein
MKTICSLTQLETWRLRNRYAPARVGKGLLTPTGATLGRQVFGHSEVFKQWPCAVCRDRLQVEQDDLHLLQQRPEP